MRDTASNNWVDTDTGADTDWTVGSAPQGDNYYVIEPECESKTES